MSDRATDDSPGIRVRVVHPDDWEMWRELRLRSLADSPDAFGSTLEREQGLTEADWRQRLRSVAVVVTVDGVPAAMGGGFQVREGWMQVFGMWTDPAYRGRGLSRKVLDVVVVAARGQGLHPVLNVTRGSSAARRAYERYGFEATGESEPLRPGSEVVTDLMVLPEPPGRRD